MTKRRTEGKVEKPKIQSKSMVTTRLSMLALCFGVMLFIFFLQFTVIRDTNIWKVKLMNRLSNSQLGRHWNVNGSAVISCDYSHDEYDLCRVNGSTLFDPASSTIYAMGPHTQNQSHVPVKIRPYPLKSDKLAMAAVKELNLTEAPTKLSCGVTHRTPALVFSAAGYTGNYYHEINENFIPLFITITSLFPNQDVTLLVTEGKSWWFQKYGELLSALSPLHSIINANNLSTVHCFPSATIGLMKHGPMMIDPKLLPNPKTLFDFRAFLGKVYTEIGTPFMQPNENGKPRLTLISRRRGVSRVILNEEDVIKVGEEIGFNVHVFEPSTSTPMAQVYGVVHSSEVLLGVHGAGLTNFLLMKPGSVLVQVVPFHLEWVSETYYKKPPIKLGLEYVEYKIELNESSLLEKYGADSLVIKDPAAFQSKYSHKRVYWTEQNVRIDIIRFRSCLIKAYEKAKIFMSKVH